MKKSYFLILLCLVIAAGAVYWLGAGRERMQPMVTADNPGPFGDAGVTGDDPGPFGNPDVTGDDPGPYEQADVSVDAGAPLEMALRNLIDLDWQLIALNGEEVRMDGDEAPRQALTLRLNGEERSVQGFAGCNMISASYDATDKAVTFSPFVATRMTCPAQQMETAYLAMLSDVAGWSVDAGILSLKDAQGAVVAVFQQKVQ